jgi:hypothetical protein
MATVKKIFGDYTIQSIGPADGININSPTVTINGNMVVNGITTTVESTNTVIYDNFVILNGNVGPASQPLPINAGLEVNRGALANVQIRWNEIKTAWEITQPGRPNTYANIAIATDGGGIQLSANLDMKTFALYSGTFDRIYFDSNVGIKNTTIPPGTVPGYNVIYTNTPITSRDSGVYVTNQTTQGAQLTTKRQALLYSLIFSS